PGLPPLAARTRASAERRRSGSGRAGPPSGGQSRGGLVSETSQPETEQLRLPIVDDDPVVEAEPAVAPAAVVDTGALPALAAAIRPATSSVRRRPPSPGCAARCRSTPTTPAPT